jgi:hypothetical protein
VVDFFKGKCHYIFGILLVVSIIPFFGYFFSVKKEPENKPELFDRSLSRINSMEKAVNYVDSVYSTFGFQAFDTAQYVYIASKFTKERFYHGLSRYSFAENWLAVACAKIFWSHMSAIVCPNDILKHPDGLCSQQTIVFMEILRRKQISVRSVGLGYKEGPGHFLSEIKYNHDWHIHDVTKEPHWHKVVNHHLSMEYYLSNKDSLFLAYEGKLSRPVFDKILEKVEYGNANELPARNMLLFHKATKFFTSALPFTFLSLFLFCVFKRKKQFR